MSIKRQLDKSALSHFRWFLSPPPPLAHARPRAHDCVCVVAPALHTGVSIRGRRRQMSVLTPPPRGKSPTTSVDVSRGLAIISQPGTSLMDSDETLTRRRRRRRRELRQNRNRGVYKRCAHHRASTTRDHRSSAKRSEPTSSGWRLSLCAAALHQTFIYSIDGVQM